MAALIVLAFLFGGGFTFIIVRLSVSCMFWASKYRFDKMHVFKIYFPYYIIGLFSLCITAIIGLDKSTFATYYFGSVFFTSLLIWRYEVMQHLKIRNKKGINLESNHPNLP